MARRWSPAEDAELLAYLQAVRGAGQQPDWGPWARKFGVTGNAVRLHANAIPEVPRPVRGLPGAEQDIEDSVRDGVREVRSRGTRIRTVEDLLAHIEADLDRFEVARSEATKYEQASKGPDGTPQVTELYRVFVQLRPKVAGDREQVEAMLEAAFAERHPLKPRILLRTRHEDLTQEIIAADAHIGKRAWPSETGGAPYDTSIADRLLRDCLAEHIAHGDERRVGRRCFRILGDWSNHDTLAQTTTKGTQVDSDSRLQKILDVGAHLLFDVVSASARTTPTEVMFVPGNHDEVLTWAFQKIIATYFRDHPNVRVNTEFKSRKYDLWGKMLLGFAHGDKAKVRNLAGLMTSEAPHWWGNSLWREIHTGHLHSIAAVETVDGVITRTAPSLSAIDAWHAENGYVGALRGMEAYFYHKEIGLVDMHLATPGYESLS